MFLCVCVFCLLCIICEKHYKPIRVQYYMAANIFSQVPRLDLWTYKLTGLECTLR